MGADFRENWKRLANKTSRTADTSKDIVRLEDVSSVSVGGDLSGSIGNATVDKLKGVELSGTLSDGMSYVYSSSEGVFVATDIASQVELDAASGVAGYPVVGTPNDGQVLTFNGTSFVPSGVSVGGGGASNSKQFGYFLAEAAIAYGSNPAAFTTRNGHGVLGYDDSIEESVFYQGVSSPDLDTGADILVDIHWFANSTTGNVTWKVSFESMDGTSSIDTDDFAAAQTTNTTVGASGLPNLTTITFTNAQADNLPASTPYRLLVQRDIATDNLVGDAQSSKVVVRQA